jgi:hypothetical protein
MGDIICRKSMRVGVAGVGANLIHFQLVWIFMFKNDPSCLGLGRIADISVFLRQNEPMGNGFIQNACF